MTRALQKGMQNFAPDEFQWIAHLTVFCLIQRPLAVNWLCKTYILQVEIANQSQKGANLKVIWAIESQLSALT